MAEALGRTISTSLKFRGGLTAKERAEEIAHQLSGIGGRRSVGFGPQKVLSLPDAVSVALSRHYNFMVNGNAKPVYQNGELKQGNGHATPEVASLINGQSEEKDSNLNLFSQENQKAGDICPSCGASAFVYEEGCSKCYVCGHSEC